jgi:hypothetical protein
VPLPIEQFNQASARHGRRSAPSVSSSRMGRSSGAGHLIETLDVERVQLATFRSCYPYRYP